MAEYRQSALLLHGLNEPDRRWVLERLDEKEQRFLGEHLAELRNLGIPGDPTLIDVFRHPEPVAADDQLRSASVAQIQILLADEPIWLVRHVLSLEDWPWRQDFLATLAISQRERFLAGRQAPLRGKTAERLRWQLAQGLARAAVGSAECRTALPARRSVFHALLKAFRQWL